MYIQLYSPFGRIKIKYKNSQTDVPLRNYILTHSAYGSPIIPIFAILSIFAKFRQGHLLRGRWIQMRYINCTIFLRHSGQHQRCHECFLPREKPFPAKFILATAAVTTIVLSPVRNYPPSKNYPSVNFMLAAASHMFHRVKKLPLWHLRLRRGLKGSVRERVTIIVNLLLLLCVRSWRAICWR